MSPLMSEILAAADFVEMDMTYKAAVQMEYLLNVVALLCSVRRLLVPRAWSIVECL